MKKYILDLTVKTVERISPKHVLIRLFYAARSQLILWIVSKTSCG